MLIVDSFCACEGMQASLSDPYPQIMLDKCLCSASLDIHISHPISPIIHAPEEEIMLGPACWLWDYLRRSGMRGFFLPLSGGIDSCTSALIVASMCRLICQKLENEDSAVISDVMRITGRIPNDARELAGSLFCTCYMASSNSSMATKQRAKELANEIGSLHLENNITGITDSLVAEFHNTTGKTPRFSVLGGTPPENLALQNIQARSRMVLGYFLAQLVPWTIGSKGGLLVLGSANVDECLRGYFTKYDCSSADLNPIGSISKRDINRFVIYYREKYNVKCLESFISATPTAELVPTGDGITSQSDENEMGLTYDELSVFGRLRKISKCGPVSAYRKLCALWKDKYSKEEILEKTKHFFKYYGINRHKMTTLTPSYHAESYSPDDNRHDLRPFLYPPNLEWQFENMDN
eukprot:Partr_v1_DN27880_c1_g1_i10_m23172 putative glutamine-dependent NAD